MPWVIGTIAVAARHPHVYVDIAALPAADERVVFPIIGLCIKKGLGDRLLFGSDFPIVDPARYALRLKRGGPGRVVRRILGLPALTPQLRDQLLGLNAARLLKLA
jgi:predicted TIM-barrel fold metal-dependent hydrolase